MYISLKWLKEYIDIPAAISPEELGRKLTMHTVEIDSVMKQSDKFKNIVVGEILAVEKHPNADMLQLAKVDIGKKELNIVCGASNIRAGQKVPVALSGASLPNGIVIDEVKVRGVKSEGMLCAEDELGLGEDHGGIMILDKKAGTGKDFSQYMGMDDIIFEVDNKSITHRPDLWSHWGMAREIAAFLDIRQKLPFKHLKRDKLKIKGKNKVKVRIEDYELCSRYIGLRIDGIKIEPSPQWMQEKLIAVGVRPINNIVDITNYVMFEMGQPMHAFDQEKIDEIVVRRAKEGEKIETLDTQKRELDKNTLLITDGKEPIAIAGVMGGGQSEVSPQTRSIILEAANFNFISIRKTSARLGLRTEASKRFEKALDPNLAEQAMLRAVELVLKLLPKARVAGEPTDKKKFKINQKPINIRLDWLNKIIGQEIPVKSIERILIKLGFSLEVGANEIKVIVPSWRATRDISQPEDIVEEIARIYGYNNLKPQMPNVEMRRPEINQEKAFIRNLRSRLSLVGSLSEVYNYSFVGEDQLKKLGINFDSHLKLANPITNEQTILRQSLAPNLIKNILTNQSRFKNIKIYEIGSIYSSISGDLPQNNEGSDMLPHQEKRLGIVIAGEASDDMLGWVKGAVRIVIEAEFQPTETKPDWAEGGNVARIVSRGQDIGYVCMVDNKIAKQIGLKKQTAIAEIFLPALMEASKIEKEYFCFREYDKYPALTRDLAFVVDMKVLYNDIRDKIKNFHKYIDRVELFDVYFGDKLGKNKKNLAFHIIYQADKTLIADEVDVIEKNLAKELKERFGAQIRNF